MTNKDDYIAFFTHYNTFQVAAMGLRVHGQGAREYSGRNTGQQTAWTAIGGADLTPIPLQLGKQALAASFFAGWIPMCRFFAWGVFSSVRESRDWLSTNNITSH